MNKVRFGLIFPKMVYVDRVKFKGRRGEEGDETPIYRLDWKIFDDKISNSLKKWWYSCEWDKKKGDFPGTLSPLPEKYNWVTELEYCIDRHYLDEIKRMSREGETEWGMERGFDTSIREMCLEPAETFISCAFKLIADCIYDRETNYFSRKYSKPMVEALLIYRFWVHQTGRGLPWFKSGLADIERHRTEWLTQDIWSNDKQWIIGDLEICKDIREFEESQNNYGVDCDMTEEK